MINVNNIIDGNKISHYIQDNKFYLLLIIMLAWLVWFGLQYNEQIKDFFKELRNR